MESSQHQLLCLVRMESLRLFTPIPVSFRQTWEDTWVEGVFVPKGTFVYVGVSVFFLFLLGWFGVVERGG